MSLRYIAASLGLSVTTVSRALAGYSDVAEETRKRIKAEAERIGYVPNAIARRLQKGRTDTIGIVAPTGLDAVADVYLYTAFAAAWTRLAELDRDLVLLPTVVGDDGSEIQSRPFRRAVEERRVDGLLLLRTLSDDRRLPFLRDAKIPFVVIGAEHVDRPEVNAIGIDDVAASDEILARLAGFGHRRVTIVVPEGGFAFARSRTDAFAARASAHSIELRSVPGSFCEEGGRAVTARLLAEDQPPTAIVYYAYRMALGGLRALSDSVLVAGRHVSVVSFGDNVNLLYSSPPVTAVRAPIDEMARHAVDVLIGEIEGRPVEAIRRWPATLVRRQSDGPLVTRPN